MSPEKLTTRLQLALSDARSLAVGRDHQFIEPAHLLIARLDQRDGGVRPPGSRRLLTSRVRALKQAPSSSSGATSGCRPQLAA